MGVLRTVRNIPHILKNVYMIETRSRIVKHNSSYLPELNEFDISRLCEMIHFPLNDAHREAAYIVEYIYIPVRLSLYFRSHSWPTCISDPESV